MLRGGVFATHLSIYSSIRHSGVACHFRVLRLFFRFRFFILLFERARGLLPPREM